MAMLTLSTLALQTRLQDWREGGLSMEYTLDKLREASDQLQQYENKAAPPGWVCHWDRYAAYLLFDITTRGPSSCAPYHKLTELQ